MTNSHNDHARVSYRQAFKAMVFVGACALTTGSALAADAEDPIKMTLNDWTGQLISTKIMGGVLAHHGYNVEFVQADYTAQFAGLKTGDLHVAMEIWETTSRDLIAEAVATGNVENMGETGMKAIEEWWYPSYMEETCPGLPNWEALLGCPEAFSTPETAPKGRYLGAPPGWGGFDEERVKALGLEFEVVHAGSDGTMFAELDSAYRRKAPIVLWAWAPHWVPSKYDGKFVEFPPHEEACYTDPGWGINPDLAYDCGKPRGGVWKLAWSGVEEKWPEAHQMIQGFNISNDEMAELIGKVDLDGEDLDAVVAEWLEANQSSWMTW